MKKSFHLGLTMAGAVSAGAYTGGVLDYLLQTLDAWYNSRNRPDVPQHDISIDILSGASAGGITGAMAAVAFHLENRNPIYPGKRDHEEYCKKNVFYNAWVNLVQDDMLPVLFETSDIDTIGKPVSLLNSSFVENLAKQTIVCVPVCTTSPPPYVSRSMELILTLSNLDGFTYELSFASEGSSKYTMKQHRDFAFFRLGSDYGGDGRIPLNLQREDVGLQELVEAAPATGAFPVGLAYRKFVRKKKYILDNPDLVFYKKGIATIVGIAEEDPDEDYVTYNVDGGMLNNEPFDLTMRLMAKSSLDKKTADEGELKKEERSFDSTIIMIDPFPSDDSILEDDNSPSLTVNGKTGFFGFPAFPYFIGEAIKKVFGAMRGELLFKGTDIVQAFSQNDFSRFMIAPRRRDKKKEGKDTVYNGSVAIACGALGGFAGFFDKDFRRHDFFLGRANCQSFLRKYFRVRLQDGVPVNPLFAEGYNKESLMRFRFQDPLEKEALIKKGEDPAKAPWYVPIIPDVHQGDPAYDEIPPVYPKFNIENLDKHKRIILSRLKIVAKSFNSKWWYRSVVNSVFLFGSGKLYRVFRNTIEKQLREWKLL